MGCCDIGALSGVPTPGCVDNVSGVPLGAFLTPTEGHVDEQSSSNGIDLVFTYDAGLQAGSANVPPSMMVVSVATGNANGYQIIEELYDDGWALISAGRNAAATQFSLITVAKHATADDVLAGSLTFEVGGSAAASAGAWIRIEGVDESSLPVIGQSGQVLDATSPYSSGTVQNREAPGLAYYFIGINANNAITVPGTLTEIAELGATDTNSVRFAAGRKAVARNGVADSEDFTTAANHNAALHTLLLRGAAA